MDRRTTIRWTRTAKEGLKQLDRKIRLAIIDKLDKLAECDDPRNVYKPLQGPLRGHYSIKTSRYRTIFTVREETLANGDVLVHLTVLVVMVGQRKEGDKRDVYRLAQKLISMTGLQVDGEEPPRESPDTDQR